MKYIKQLNEEILIEKAARILFQELGPVEALRFLNIPRKKRMESVKRHRAWQEGLTKNQFFDEVFAGPCGSCGTSINK